MVTGSSPRKHCLPGHLANHEARVALALPAPSWEPKYSFRKQREELAVGLSGKSLHGKSGGNVDSEGPW